MTGSGKVGGRFGHSQLLCTIQSSYSYSYLSITWHKFPMGYDACPASALGLPLSPTHQRVGTCNMQTALTSCWLMRWLRLI